MMVWNIITLLGVFLLIFFAGMGIQWLNDRFVDAKTAIDTTELVVGQKVEMVSRWGDTFGGDGTVIKITPWGVKINLDDSSPALDFYGKEVYSFNHDGKECREDGTPGGYGPWRLKLPDEGVVMSDYEYVRRKSDGLYVSVDGGFTDDRHGKAFVFYEGCAGRFSDWMTDEYEFVPLDDDEVAEFQRRSEDD